MKIFDEESTNVEYFFLPTIDVASNRNGEGWRNFQKWKKEFKKLNPSIFFFPKIKRKRIYNSALRVLGLRTLK